MGMSMVFGKCLMTNARLAYWEASLAEVVHTGREEKLSN